MQSPTRSSWTSGESGNWGDDLIDDLLQEHRVGDQNANSYGGIRSDHWKSANDYPQCMNPKCCKKFSLTERHHHCRRCGLVFCHACSSFRRRLNVLAHPDPSGRIYKVCERCFDEPQSLGANRNLLDEFNSHRWALLQRTSSNHGDMVDGPVRLQPGLQSKLEVMKACRRLTEGFKSSLEAPVLYKAASNITSLIKRPSWKQAPNYVYERLVPQCRRCSSQFGLFQSRNYCTVCGATICRACSLFDLIVFVPSSRESDGAKWAVIKVLGCPDKEPEVCEYLRTCSTCRETLADIQCRHFQQTTLDADSGNSWHNIETVYIKLHAIRGKIDERLPMYQELIDSLSLGSANNGRQPGSNTKLLAKAQGDLSDHMTQLVVTAQSIKSLQPSTRCQTTIVKNMTKSTFQFYHESKFLFRELQRRLEEITPLDVLTTIQDIVDNDAINSCYLSVKQLVLEVLHLTTKAKLSDTLILLLTPLEQVVLEELQRTVKRSGQDWDDHQSCINQLLQLQLKDHKFIRFSVGNMDIGNVEHLLWRRATHLLTQIQLQLLNKTSDRKFISAKSMLDELMTSLSEAKSKS